jgi:hypothetical protein
MDIEHIYGILDNFMSLVDLTALYFLFIIFFDNTKMRWLETAHVRVTQYWAHTIRNFSTCS